MKILAVKWRRLGDTILWTSALKALRDLFPAAEIHIAFPAAYADLFIDDPRFQRLYLLAPGRRQFFARAREWRSLKFDRILNFHASHRTAWLCRLADPGERIIHHHSRKKKRAMSQRIIPHLGTPMAASERDLNVIRSLGWNGEAPPTQIFVSDDTKNAASKRLSQNGVRKDRPLLLLGVAASRTAKQWPIQNYAELARQLQSRYEVGVVYESESIFRGREFFRASLANHATLLHCETLRDLMGTMALAQGYVGSDSGAKHLACALSVPTLTLFGPESIGEWHGYSAPHRTIQKKVRCRNQNPEIEKFAYCGVDTCPLASHACMETISVEEVYEEIPLLL